MWRDQAPSSAAFRVLVRHADAGDRSRWRGPDLWRPLTDIGQRQSDAVVDMLRGLTIVRVLSSPSLRCRQTLVPLARALGLDIEQCSELDATVAPEAVLGLLADPATASSVLCTHRETMQSVFGHHLREHRAAIHGTADPMAMAAAWIVRGPVAGAAPGRWDYLGSGAALVPQSLRVVPVP